MTIGQTLRDKYIALDENKWYLVHKTAVINKRASFKTGTSHSVSAIVLDLAAASNIASSEG